MSKFAINPNALPDLAAEQAASLERDRAALMQDAPADDAGTPPARDGLTPLAPLMTTPDPRYRHGDIDIVEAQLAARHAHRPAKKSAPAPDAAQPAKAHPLVAALVASLPAPGAVWTQAERAAWLRAAEGAFALVYKAAP